MKFKNIITMLIVLVLVSSCSDKEQNLTWLEGTWVSTENYTFDDGKASSLLYQFNGDGTFKALSRVIKDGNINDVLGYTYRAEGTFTLNESNLTLSFNAIYLSDDNLTYYTELVNLMFVDYNETQELGITFNKEKSKLTFIYPACPPNANCIGNQSFNRLAFIE